MARKKSGIPAGALDLDDVRDLAGEMFYERGVAYYHQGRVSDLAEYEGRITARVHGTIAYRVEIEVAGGEIADWSCSCPVGGEFCKHCVAVALAWNESGQTLSEPPTKKKGKKKGRGVTMDDVRDLLAGRSTDALVAMIMDLAVHDDRLQRRLFGEVVAAREEGFDLDTVRGLIDDAVYTDEYVGYSDVYDYETGVNEVITTIEGLLDRHAAAVIELAEYALDALETAVNNVEDESGLPLQFERLHDLLLAACRKARPDPLALAQRLLARELGTDWGIPSDMIARYADVLGEAGRAEYRRLVEAEWAKLPALAPGKNDSDRYGRRSRISDIMESLARETGDVEAVVAVLKKDLSSAHDFHRIAEAYRSAGKHDRAAEWAEKGLKTFPPRGVQGLVDMLAGEYRALGRGAEAVALAWDAFSRTPGLDEYQFLKGQCDQMKSWPEWREKALAFLRECIVRKRKPSRDTPPWFPLNDGSELVRILLWEGSVETAWAEARALGCSFDLMMELARRREADHPEDALPIYRQTVNRVLAETNAQAYAKAVGLLRDIRRVMGRLGKEADFGPYYHEIRAANKRKRNFIKLLDAEEWG